MIYFSFIEVINSIVASAGYGLSIGIFYTALSVSFSFLQFFISLPSIAYSRAKGSKKSFKTLVLKALKADRSSRGFLFDFIIVLVYGMGFHILLYVVCDGMIRLYPAVISIFFAIVFYRIFGVHSERIITCVLSFFLACLCAALTAVICFFIKLLDFFKKLEKKSN